MKGPIVLLGSERSGSNLLRVLLGNHSEISAPVPTHFCDVFCGIIPLYGPLEERVNSSKLLEHMIRYCNTTFSGWALNTSVEQILDNYDVCSFSTAFEALYREEARISGKKYWFCKDNNMHKYAFTLLFSRPDIRFLYLYRDPRDQVASWMRNPLFLMTPRKAIKKWVEEQDLIRQLVVTWKLNVHFVKYEDLIEDAEQVISVALRACGFEPEVACFQTSRNHPEAKRFKLWENIEKPIMKANRGHFSDVLNSDEVRLIESEAGALMDWLRYERETEGDFRGAKSIKYRFRELNREKQNRKKAAEDRSNGEHDVLLEKRMLRREIMEELKSR